MSQATATLTTRRAILGGLAAAIPTAIVASPCRASGSDAELLELGRQWEVSAAHLDAHREVLYAAEHRLEHITPAMPAALFAQSEDAYLGLLTARGKRREDGRWRPCYEPWQVEEYRTQPYFQRTIEEEPAHQARIDKRAARAKAIVEAYDDWIAAKDVAAELSGYKAAEALEDQLNEENRALRRRIVERPAATWEGIAVKVRVATWCWGGVDEVEAELVHDLNQNGPTAEAIAHGIARDLALMAKAA